MTSTSGSAGYRPQSVQPQSQTSLANAANAAGADGSRYYGKPDRRTGAGAGGVTRGNSGNGSGVVNDDDDNSSSNSSGSAGSGSDYNRHYANNNNSGAAAVPLSVSPIKPSGGSSSDARKAFFMNR